MALREARRAAMKRKLFIIAIIINFHYVTLNTSRGNVFEQLLEHWLDVDGDAIERGGEKYFVVNSNTFHPLSLIPSHQKMSQKGGDFKLSPSWPFCLHIPTLTMNWLWQQIPIKYNNLNEKKMMRRWEENNIIFYEIPRY